MLLKVLSRDGDTVVGRISKQWSGLIKEAFTDADNFGITFPIDLDVRMKAVMLGACFLIVSSYPLNFCVQVGMLTLCGFKTRIHQ